MFNPNSNQSNSLKIATVNFEENSQCTSIGKYAFAQNGSITSVTIPDSVTSIGDNVFQNCTHLTSVVLGSGLTTISQTAFYNCTRLMSVTCLATTPPSLDYSSFYGVPADCIFKVPAGSVDAYKAAFTAANWSERADYIQAI